MALPHQARAELEGGIFNEQQTALSALSCPIQRSKHFYMPP